MYAVFQSGSKQHRVSVGQIIRLEKLDTEIGMIIEFNHVMMIINGIDTYIGNPFVNGSKIIAEVLKHGRKSKIFIIKFKRRKHFRKHQGHRQWFTDIKITNIFI